MSLGKAEWLQSAATRLALTGSHVDREYQTPLLWCEQGGCDDRGLAYQPYRIDTAQAGAYTRSDKTFVAATLQHAASPRMTWLGRGSWLRTDFTDHRPASGEFSVTDRYGLELRGEARRADARVVVVGAEGARTALTSDIFGIHTETALAGFAEAEQRLRSARLTAGARLDYVETDGGGLSAVVSPRIGVVLPRGSVVWRASVGRGFRAPSLAERFVQTSIVGRNCGPEPRPRARNRLDGRAGHRDLDALRHPPRRRAVLDRSQQLHRAGRGSRDAADPVSQRAAGPSDGTGSLGQVGPRRIAAQPLARLYLPLDAPPRHHAEPAPPVPPHPPPHAGGGLRPGTGLGRGRLPVHEPVRGSSRPPAPSCLPRSSTCAPASTGDRSPHSCSSPTR